LSKKIKTTRDPLIKIICVDRGPDLYQQLVRIFSSLHVQLFREPSIDRVLERFESDAFDVLILASSAASGGEITGIELLEIITEKSPATQILFLVNPKEIAMASLALRVGTYHYARLPVSDEELLLLIQAAMEKRPQYGPNLLLKEELGRTKFEQMVGGSPPMQDVYRQIRQAAATDIPVLLVGETGTGKDLVAQAIHQLSARKTNLFLPVHLGALPAELVASELFGHEKGAFTGAQTRYIGSFEQGNMGTIFLDEISTVDESVQVSLLRLLETKKFQRLGGRKTIRTDIRIIAATNVDLYDAVQQGMFREDLYYRLEVFSIALPPVRQRPGDVSLLIDHFLKRFNDAYSKNIIGVSPECVSLLESYDWQGNVREIKNVLHRAVILCSGEVLLPEHLPQRFRTGKPIKKVLQFPLGTSLEIVEREVIRQTLHALDNNRQRVAAVLGISRRTLYNKLAKYNLK
jgi:DNA-binding NtrC family response regulator